ncbi:MAG: SDR family NAD(P)-dependent oxidoreductase [Planctomycetota bacterium]|nr:MAG: SDR family NAD(P)-dependent oxidoreductase [Planctomycetota bacterium]REJ98783.1 MAG: SDR family NAD(P)-dependent oxidoreductase [Planctomycetota bacterium]REK27628.1 MAG: SDR family NAD(P)-dependent oxidoreductase [Planctomycetota bacterium]REK43239.1 MAG: SDR family NAD(P)-dependent oxidoreductase [Planctomycetota bacterium]
MSLAYLEELFGLTDQVAVVIGATGELGGALATGLARAGAKVVVAGRSRERGEARVAAIKQLGGEADFAEVDVMQRDSLAALLAEVLERHGKVDILINCAGVNAADPYFDIDPDDFDRVLAANLRATHLGCQIFGRHMADAGGGAILNIGSVSSHLPLSRVFAYSASKAAVVSLTKNVAREFAPLGIRVNALCPGFFPAEQNRKILDEKRISDVMRKTPMARFGEPEELIGATLLLVSRKAGSFITGAEVYVDGGFTATSI